MRRRIYDRLLALHYLSSNYLKGDVMCLLAPNQIPSVSHPLYFYSGYLLTYFSSDSTTTANEAYLFAALVCLCSWFITVIHPPYFFGVMKNGMMMRVSCSGLIYKKALTLSNAAMMQTTTGQIVNLLSNDVQVDQMSIAR